MTASRTTPDRRRRAVTAVERLPATVLFLVNPLLLFPFVVDQALLRWLLFAAGAALALLGSSRLRRWVAGCGREIWPLAALVALVGWHLGRGAPAAEGSRWLVLLVLGALAYGYCRTLDAAARQRSLELLVMAGGAIGLYAIVQAAGWDVISYPAESWMYRVVTTFGHRNFTATFLLTALFAALAVAARPSSPTRPRLTPFVVLIVLGVLATGARFPIAAAVVAVAVQRTRSWRQAVAVVAVAALCGLGLVVLGGGAAVLVRTETIALRAGLYRSMVPLALAHPLLGGGPGWFARGIPALAGPSTPGQAANLVFLHAHNLPAELVIELGVVGLVLAAAFVLPLYARLLRSGPRAWSWLVWGHLCWLVINLYDVSCFSYAGWLGLWPMLAFIWSDLEADAGKVRPPALAPRWLSAVPPALALGCAVVLVPMTWSSHLCSAAARADGAGQGDIAVQLYEAAGRSWPLPLDQRYREAGATLAAGRVSDALHQLSAVEAEAPAFSSVRHHLAMAYARIGWFGQAVTMIDRHLAAHPGDRDARADRARLVARLQQAP